MGSSTVMYDDASSPVTFKGEDAKNLVNGVSAKAWVNFNGSVVAIRDSFNVSSITDNGAGSWTVNLINAMNSLNYSPISSGVRNSGISGVPSVTNVNTEVNARILTTSTIGIAGVAISASSVVLTDCEECNLAVFSN